jgi:hypothetical protein
MKLRQGFKLTQIAMSALLSKNKFIFKNSLNADSFPLPFCRIMECHWLFFHFAITRYYSFADKVCQGLRIGVLIPGVQERFSILPVQL